MLRFPQKRSPNHITQGWEAVELWPQWDPGRLEGAGGPQRPSENPQPALRVDEQGRLSQVIIPHRSSTLWVVLGATGAAPLFA